MLQVILTNRFSVIAYLIIWLVERTIKNYQNVYRENEIYDVVDDHPIFAVFLYESDSSWSYDTCEEESEWNDVAPFCSDDVFGVEYVTVTNVTVFHTVFFFV